VGAQYGKTPISGDFFGGRNRNPLEGTSPNHRPLPYKERAESVYCVYPLHLVHEVYFVHFYET